MLILARYPEQEVVIGEGESQVVLRVVGIRTDGQVRLGFDADPRIPIHRREVHQRIEAEQVGVCPRCQGERRIANTAEGEPWSAWESLPPVSDLGVRTGLVKPIPCPLCAPIRPTPVK